METRFWIAIEFLIGFLALLQGIFALTAPRGCIHFFQTICSLLNWRVEPIDWARELRNTKLLGISLIVLAFMIFLTASLQPQIGWLGCLGWCRL